MPIRRFNSTGRRTISRSHVQLTLQRTGGSPAVLSASLDLSSYKLPPDAKVFVEASQLSTFMRFEHGVVANPKPANGQKLVLTEFSPDQLPAFRVKVVSVGERPGLLLAESGNLAAEPDKDNPAKTISLLNFAPDDLGDEVWRVSYDANGPVVQMNRNLGDWKVLAAAGHFRAVVYPAILRTVLVQILLIDEFDFYEEGEEGWQARWAAFARLLNAEVPPIKADDAQTKLDWINDAVESFARKHGFMAQLGEFNPSGVAE